MTIRIEIKSAVSSPVNVTPKPDRTSGKPGHSRTRGVDHAPRQ